MTAAEKIEAAGYEDVIIFESPSYPEDMQKIMAYLESHGTLHVSAKTVERLYRDFSDTYAASWLIVRDEILEAFEEWLENIDI